MGSGNYQSQGQAVPYKHPENIVGVVGAGTEREKNVHGEKLYRT